MTRQMADDEVLRPCPFCGEAAEFVPYKHDGLTLKCKSFGCAKFSQRVMRHSLGWLREKMAESWNNRPAVAALQAERDGWSARALREQTAHHEAVAALEALRGQVAGLADEWRQAAADWRNVGFDVIGAVNEKHAEKLAELPAIKERVG